MEDKETDQAQFECNRLEIFGSERLLGRFFKLLPIPHREDRDLVSKRELHLHRPFRGDAVAS
jgi:hypothetical protein